MSQKPFRLHTMLRYRQQVEDQLKGELARISHALVEAQRVRLQQQAQRESHLNALRVRAQSGLDAGELLTYGTILQHLSAQMVRQDQVIDTLQQAAEKTRGSLEQAMRDRKVIENFQEKARMVQKKQNLREEERSLGEIALQRFAPS